jgi:ech hydrogenase subunit F
VKEHRRPGRITRVTVKNLFEKPATISYPTEASGPKIEKHYRGRLLYDPKDCINCRLCMHDCPTGALTIINDGTKEEKKMRAELNLSRCIFCCQCVDSCRRGCLSFSQKVDLAVMAKPALTVDPSSKEGIAGVRTFPLLKLARVRPNAARRRSRS